MLSCISSSSSLSFAAPDADVVLRSSGSDSSDFKVHKCILAVASPFFRTMFTLPQGAGKDADIPVIEVAEYSTILETLLRFVYPIQDPSVSSLDELVPIMCAAAKYEMDAVIMRLRHLLLSKPFITSSPVRVYAIAARFELEDVAKVASSHTLSVNVLDSPLSDDLKHITAYSYHRLLDLHRQRADAAQRALQTPDTITIKCVQCNGAVAQSFATPRWWEEFRVRAADELRRRPTTDRIFSLGFLMQCAQATGCARCAGSILESHVFLEKLKETIDSLPSTI
ncbi:hypothetical protein FA95DRAFT_1552320 [Auriscalpium vulgare]|uniref:Uncharacterized protein n=1 Tax=Auriscalpium vulgare TaxID=40419 RepID=A0ACB8SCY8_9AGAM|nr:hypothetical protein FA95DRAFT_1552320 [Auriscalpium vulgare]